MVAVSGENDPDGVGELPPDFAQEFGAIHLRHAHVGNYQINGLQLQQRQSGFATLCNAHLEALGAKQPSQ